MPEYPLTKTHRLELASAFHAVPRVDVAIDCVIEGQMGQAFVDDASQPRAYQIRTGPFAYHAGDPAAGRALLDALPPYTLLMPSAPGWTAAAEAAFGERLRPMDRYSLSAAALSTEQLEHCLAASGWRERVQPLERGLVAALWGHEHFIDVSDYDSADDFGERGLGYYVSDAGAIAGAAYASLICSRGAEVSLYVEPDYRRRGMATALAAQLALGCQARGLEPHWDAANPESVALALKLGYTHPAPYRAHVLMP